MADIYKTIASSGADYDSLALAEASIPGSGSDNYFFTYIEAYTDTTRVVFAFGSLNTCTVNVAEAYKCKGAVSGSHANITYSVADTNALLSFATEGNVTFNDLRIERTGENSNTASPVYRSGGHAVLTFNRCTIVHRCGGVNSGYTIYDAPNHVLGIMKVYDCFIVNSGRNNSGIGIIVSTTNGRMQLYRNTIFAPDGTLSSLVRIFAGAMDARQNVAVAAAGVTCANIFLADGGGSFTGDCDANTSSDATAPGTNSSLNKSASSLLKTLTVNSENLHFQSNAVMRGLTPGSDLSGSVGTLDIDGDTISEWYPGADYATASRFVSPGAGQFLTVGGNQFVVA